MPKTRRRDYGSGSVWRRKDGYYSASIELGWINGERKRKTFTAKTKAGVIEKQKDYQHRLYMGDAPTIANSLTLGAWLDTWLDTIAAPRVAPRTLQTHRSYVEQHIAPHIGHIRLDKLTPQHILRWHQALRVTPAHRGHDTLTESTVLRAHAVLSRALTDAMRHGYIPTNPAQRVDRPTAKPPEARFLNLDQATHLLRAVADDPYGSRWAFALLTGQRQGEVLGLRWSHVDLDQGIADIAWKLERPGYRHGCGLTPCGHPKAGNCPQRQLVMPPGREHVRLDGLALTRPKSGIHKMVVLIPSLTAWLRRHQTEQPPGVHDLVWSHQDGRPVDPRQDLHTWTELLDRLHLPAVTLHSARHTCVSLLLSLGVQETVIRQMVGHSTVAASQRYMHLDRAQAMEAAARLGQALQLEG